MAFQDSGSILDAAVRELQSPTFATTRQVLAAMRLQRDSFDCPICLHVEPAGPIARCYFALEEVRFFCRVDVNRDSDRTQRIAWVEPSPFFRFSLRVLSKDLEPEAITAQVGLVPTSAIRSEAKSLTLRESQCRAPYNAWIYEPTGTPPGEFDTRLVEFLGHLGPVANRLAALPPSCTVEVRAWIECWPEWGFTWLSVPPLASERLAQCRATLEFEVEAVSRDLPDTDLPA